MSATSPSILVVDDEIDACRNLQDILTDWGYRTDVAMNAVDAVKLVEAQSYDLVLLDLKMPETDGLRLFERIRAIRADAIGIVVTAFASPETQREARQLGVNQVLPKPVDVPQLLREINQVVTHRV